MRGEVWGSKEAIGRHSHGLLPHGKSRPLFPRPTRPRQPSPRWGGRPGGRPRRYHLPGGSRRKGRASPPVLPTGSVVAAAERRRSSHVRSLRGTGRAGGRDRASGRGSVSRPAGDCTERICTSTARSHHREGRQGDGALGAARQLSSRLAAPSTGRCLPAIAGAAACRDGDDAGAHAAGGSSRLLAIEPPARYSAEPPGGIELGEEALREFLEGVFGAAATDQGATIPFARRERRGALPLCCPPHICGLPRIMSRPVPWTRPCITRKMP